MNLFRFSSILLSVSIIFSSSFKVFSGELEKSKHTSVNELINQGILHASIQGTGGYTGECILMYLENPTNDTAFVRIEPGRLFSSSDSTIQDILITREEILVLAPGEQRKINIYGFCSEASKTSPDSAEVFGIGEMADSAIVVLAEFLDKRGNAFPEDAIQEAIWCLTDGHSVSDIYSEDLASIADLRNMVASLRGNDEHWYNIENVPDDRTTFTKYTKTISGEIEIYIPSDCVVNIFICDADGNKWDDFEKDIPYEAGTFQYSFRLTTTNWPKGKYFLCIQADEEILYKKEFDL